MTTALKICSCCKEPRTLDLFTARKDVPDGLRYDCKICVKETKAQYHQANKNKHKDQQLQRNYGISLEQYNQMLFDQGGCCLGCGRHHTEVSRSLCVDHDHKTGEVRGLLCHDCNRGLGLLCDSVETLSNLTAYLQKHQGNQ